jgi:hypothetical protein
MQRSKTWNVLSALYSVADGSRDLLGAWPCVVRFYLPLGVMGFDPKRLAI